MQAFLPSFLELSLASFTQQQERMRQQMSAMGQGAGGGNAFEEQIRQNLQLFDRAMKMFSPFNFAAATRTDDAAPAAPATATATATAKAEGSDDALNALRKQLADMQAQLDKLAKG